MWKQPENQLCPRSASPVSLVSQQKAGEQLWLVMPSLHWGHEVTSGHAFPCTTRQDPSVLLRGCSASVLSRSPQQRTKGPILSMWHLLLTWLQDQDPIKAILHLPPHQGAANTDIFIVHFSSKTVLNSLQEKERIQAHSTECWPRNCMHLRELRKRSHGRRGSRLIGSSNG